MKKNYFKTLIFFIAIAIAVPQSFSQTHILFVGRDNLGDYQSDLDLVDSLHAWGYTVEYIGSSTFSSMLDSAGNALDYNNYDAIFINETVDSKAVKSFGTTDDYPLPCINMEGYSVSNTSERWAWLFDADAELLQFASGEGTEDDMVMMITDNEHYITHNYQIGDEVTWSAATEASDIAEIRPVSIMESDVTYNNMLGQMLSHQSESGFYNFVTIDEIGGSGNKMVYWGLNHIGLNGVDQSQSLGTPAFFDLIKRSCEWAYEDAFVSSPSDIAEGMRLTAYPNPARDYVTVRYHSSAASLVKASMFNLAGQKVFQREERSSVGKNYLVLDADDFNPGVYLLQIEVEGQSEVAKVVIQ